MAGFGFDIGGMISGIAGAQAAAQAAQIQWENLQFQKDQAKKGYNLATATRTDAYGNEQYYDEALKKWVTRLTPTQEGLVRAGEHEQKLSLTEDAARNRDVRRRQETRANEAAPDYNRSLMGYRYDQPDSEDGTFGELVGLLASGREANVREAQTGLGREALRIGKGSSIPQIIKESNDLLGSMAPDNILQARQQARGEHMQDVAAHDSQYLPELAHFSNVEDDVGNAPQMFSGTPGAMGAQQSDMINQIAQAIQGGAAGVGGAYSNLASAMARTGAQGLGGSLSMDFSGGGAAGKPGYMTVPPGNSIFDPTTGQVVYTAPAYGKSAAAGGGGMGYNDDISNLARTIAGTNTTF